MILYDEIPMSRFFFVYVWPLEMIMEEAQRGDSCRIIWRLAILENW